MKGNSCRFRQGTDAGTFSQAGESAAQVETAGRKLRQNFSGMSRCVRRSRGRGRPPVLRNRFIAGRDAAVNRLLKPAADEVFEAMERLTAFFLGLAGSGRQEQCAESQSSGFRNDRKPDG